MDCMSSLTFGIMFGVVASATFIFCCNGCVVTPSASIFNNTHLQPLIPYNSLINNSLINNSSNSPPAYISIEPVNKLQII